MTKLDKAMTTNELAANSHDEKKTERVCRLCDNSLLPKFDLKLLGKHDVQYFECSNCGALQTEPPYWLDEAYRNSNLTNLDTGAAQRNIQNLAACLVITKLYKLKNVIDIGGSDGLLCRLLRDYDINCYAKDKYAQPKYAQGFTEQDFETPDLIIGFEVLEHLPNPKVDLEDLFNYKPALLLVSTIIYTQESVDWWYLTPESGQHVFFYSKKALELVASKYKYHLVICGEFMLFVKKHSPIKNLIAKSLLKGTILRLIKGVVVMLPTRGVWKDHLLQKEKSRLAQQQQV
jgi:hypothetical protein